jgi:ketosteroid isomerase-like protein
MADDQTAVEDARTGTEFAQQWESVRAEIIGDLAILSAIGEATLNSPRRQAVTRYRLTGVLVRKADRWLWRVHHGSEPAAW